MIAYVALYILTGIVAAEVVNSESRKKEGTRLNTSGYLVTLFLWAPMLLLGLLLNCARGLK